MVNKLLIFDMDGTVLDTLSDLTSALNYALAKNGLPARTTGEVRGFVGNGIRRLIERGVPDGTDVSLINAVHADFTFFYELHCADATAPYPGVREAVAALRARGYLTAVVSNKADYAVQKLVARYFPGDFDFAAGETQSVRRKPAPDMVFAALSALGVTQDYAVYVGDSEVDLETAGNAGIPCISVTWGFKDRSFLLAHGAKTLVDRPEDLPEALRRMQLQ